MDVVRRTTNRWSDASFQSVSQLENVLQELNAAIHKKRTPKKRLFKTPKLDDYRRSIIDRALQNTSKANNSINNKKKPNKFLPTSTPMPKPVNNKKYVADDSNSSILISPIAKNVSMPPQDNITSGDASQSKSQNCLEEFFHNLSKSNHNSKNSILNEVLRINKTESTSKSNQSIKLQNQDENVEEQANIGELSVIPQIQEEKEILPTTQLRKVQQLNKSTNMTQLNNIKTCSDDGLSSAVADVEEFLKNFDNCVLGLNNESINELSIITFKKPWRISQSFALPKREFDSLERNSSLVKQLNKKLPKKTYNNNNKKKSFMNKKSLATVKNTQECEDCVVENNRKGAIFESFTDKSDDDDDDLKWSDSDLEHVAAFLSATVKSNTQISVGFCDDDDSDGVSFNNRKTAKKVLSNYGENKNTTKTKGKKQNVKKLVKIKDEDDRNSINNDNSISKPSTSKATTTKASTSKATTTKANTSQATTTKASTSQATTTEANTSKATTTKANTSQATTTETSTSKQSTFQKFNDLQIRAAALENSDDGQDEIRLVDQNSRKRSTTTKQSSKKTKTNRKTNNVNKRSCPSIPETSSFNDNPTTQDTNEGIRRSARVRKQAQFKGTTTNASTSKATTTKASASQATTTKANTSKATTTKANTSKATTTKASTSKQSTFQKFNDLQIRAAALENSDDGQDEIRLLDQNSRKRSTTTKQSSKKTKINRKTNNVNKRSCPSIPETSSFNDNPTTQDTNEGIRRSARVRKQVQFKGTVFCTDSLRVYKCVNDTKEIMESNNRNTTTVCPNCTRISQMVANIIRNKSKRSKLSG